MSPVISPPQGVGAVGTAEILDASVAAADMNATDFTAAGLALMNDATVAAQRTTLSAPGFISLGSDATPVVGTAYANAATGLDIAVTNAVPVRFLYYIQWAANATTTGGRFSLNGPSITRLTYSVRWNTTATVVTQSPEGTSYDQAFTVGTASDATHNVAVIEGVLVSSASGTLALRTSAEVADPGAITVKAGSSVLYW